MAAAAPTRGLSHPLVAMLCSAGGSVPNARPNRPSYMDAGSESGRRVWGATEGESVATLARRNLNLTRKFQEEPKQKCCYPRGAGRAARATSWPRQISQTLKLSLKLGKFVRVVDQSCR